MDPCMTPPKYQLLSHVTDLSTRCPSAIVRRRHGAAFVRHGYPARFQKRALLHLGKQQIPHFQLRPVKLRFRVAGWCSATVRQFLDAVGVNFMKTKDLFETCRECLDCAV